MTQIYRIAMAFRTYLMNLKKRLLYLSVFCGKIVNNNAKSGN